MIFVATKMYFKLMKFFFFFFFNLFFVHAISQVKFPSNYFRSPVDINLSISSNFGEIRPNHFHAGLDVYTEVKSGKNIYAAADGYISRVNVSPRGYGNAIYITHPNGYVSVYGHLNEFNKSIADYIYKSQHNKQQFELEMYPLPHLFPVKQGDLIGKSGNSGRSYGAHLHFEIREELSEDPINPLFAYNIKDKVAPKIQGVYLYRFNKNSENDSYARRDELKIINAKTIKSYGRLGFGIEIHDYLSGQYNRFGVYEVDLFIDDSLYFSYQMNKFSFYEARYLNSFADFYLNTNSRKKVTKCFIEPNNQFSVYKTNGRGIFDFSDGKLHKIRIVGKDIKGNATSLSFNVQSDSSYALRAEKEAVSENRINCFREQKISTDSFKIHFHKNCLYYNIDFQYHTSNAGKGNFSKYYHIHNKNVPLHNKVTIAIKPYEIKDELKSKAIIAGITSRGNRYSAGGEWKDDFLETKINSFGTYYITVDTIPPIIRSLSIDKYNKIKGSSLDFKITDNLSGIEEYIGFIDNNWVLFKYDEKNNLITCDLPEEKINRGKHTLVLWVKDYCGNIRSFESSFFY